MEQTHAPASIEVRSVTKRFGPVAAVDDVSLVIRRGEFFSLLGPSGCGKTTLLRMIAGFETPTAGTLLLDGADVTRVPPHRRAVNLVFQHYALFPHLSVRQNVAFGLRYRDFPRREHATRVAKALELVRLSGLESRRPDALSGGQRQRVALARALVLEPAVLLLDEPLGALDQKLRKEMQVELKELQKTLGITFVFVTHDQEEALTMSDRIAVMNEGKVEQLDTSTAVFETPATEFVARFMGVTNFLSIAMCRACGLGDCPPGRTLAVRPEKLRLLREAPPTAGRFRGWPAAVEQRVYQGVNTIFQVRTDDGTPLTVCQQNTDRFEPAAEPGARAFVWIDPSQVIEVRASGEPAVAEPAGEVARVG